MNNIYKLNEDLSNILYHVSNKFFDTFSLKFLLKGAGVNKQGKGIYLSENIDYILQYYKKGKKNFLYTVILKNHPILINYDEIVTDNIYEHLEKLNDDYINMLCKPFNRKITGVSLLHILKMYDNNIEHKLVKCGRWNSLC